MEDRALEILRIMLGRRKLDTKTERVTVDRLDRANAYTIGKVLVLFSQKERGLQERDIMSLLEFADSNDYGTSVIIVALQRPSENLLKVAKSLTKRHVQFFHIRQLQFDITTHRYAQPHRILNEEERKRVLETFHITDPELVLPWIDSQDPMAKWIGAVPGDIVEVLRHSDVAGTVPYYRYCVEDANVQ